MLKRFFKIFLVSFFFLISFDNVTSNKSIDTLINSVPNNIFIEKPVMVLEIPEINLIKNIYDLNSNLNDVSINVELLKSSLPDKEFGNISLAAHSGLNLNAYFDDLFKLELGNEIKIYYKDKVYLYELVNIYDILKNGEVSIIKENKTTTLTLITCKKNDNSKQTVFISKLIKII